ncbi:MAG: glycosyltransferase family 2 protein [Patescibacteria group bacterium]|nr:glycosyltransferase family 2 protein [Patescibacteria group bacterium]
MKITAAILTKNEAKNIDRCLKSVIFCDEIIIVDDFSQDETLKRIPRLKKVKVYQRRVENDFSAQRNFALERAKFDWVLFVDADEEVSQDLQQEIKRFFLSRDIFRQQLGGIYLKRRDFFWGKELKFGEVFKARVQGLLRLINKRLGKFSGRVHEEFRFFPDLDTKTIVFKNFLNHYPHPTLKEFIIDIDYYSTLRAKELAEQGQKGSALQMISYPLGKFLTTYFFWGGFLDGEQGFVYSFLMSFHSFLVRAKLYQMTLR